MSNKKMELCSTLLVLFFMIFCFCMMFAGFIYTKSRPATTPTEVSCQEESSGSLMPVEREQDKDEFLVLCMESIPKVVEGSEAIPLVPLSPELQEYIKEECKSVGVDYMTMLAIIWQESNFEESSINYNSNGSIDHGLCQINTCNFPTAYEQGLDPMQTKDNIKIAVGLIAGNMKYGEEFAIRAYKSGTSGAFDGGGYEYLQNINRKKEMLLEGDGQND